MLPYLCSYFKKIELNELLAPLTGHFTLKLTWKMKKQCLSICRNVATSTYFQWDWDGITFTVFVRACVCVCVCVWEWTFNEWTIRIRQILKKYPQLCTKDGKKMYGFGMTRGWVLSVVTIYIIGWTIPCERDVKMWKGSSKLVWLAVIFRGKRIILNLKFKVV